MNHEIQKIIKYNIKLSNYYIEQKIQTPNWKKPKFDAKLYQKHYGVKYINYIFRNQTIKDPFSFKFLNMRAGTILRAEHCCICGIHNSLADIQMHHLKKIAKDKKTNFGQILNQVKRKQIPVCLECHTSIHNGSYDGMSLSDLTFPLYLDKEQEM